MRLLLACLVLLMSCRPDAIDAMARTTVLADEQLAAATAPAVSACLEESQTLAEYKTCTAPWRAASDSVSALRQSTEALDVSTNRRSFRRSACAWYEAVMVLDAVSPVELPALQPAKTSKWSRRC